jgi:hypothetical protein
MIGFQIYVNGKKLHTTGIGDHGVLSSILSLACRRQEAEDELRLSIGGLYSDTREHVEWEAPDVQVGDEVTIRIIETNEVDSPTKRKPHNPEKDLKSQQDYVRAMAKRLGWSITESPTSR